MTKTPEVVAVAPKPQTCRVAGRRRSRPGEGTGDRSTSDRTGKRHRALRGCAPGSTGPGGPGRPGTASAARPASRSPPRSARLAPGPREPTADRRRHGLDRRAQSRPGRAGSDHVIPILLQNGFPSPGPSPSRLPAHQRAVNRNASTPIAVPVIPPDGVGSINFDPWVSPAVHTAQRGQLCSGAVTTDGRPGRACSALRTERTAREAAAPQHPAWDRCPPSRVSAEGPSRSSPRPATARRSCRWTRPSRRPRDRGGMGGFLTVDMDQICARRLQNK